MILLKGSRFTHTPESKSFTKQRGSFYFAFFWFPVFTRRPIRKYNVSFHPRKLVFPLVICNEIIAQRLNLRRLCRLTIA